MLTDQSAIAARHIATPTDHTDRAQSLRAAAQEFEATFLAEMLRAAGAGQPVQSFGGGVGEEQFASFLVDEHANRMAARGGIGLAEVILRQLLADSAPRSHP